MAIKDIIDEKNDIKVNVSDEMRASARALVIKYGSILESMRLEPGPSQHFSLVRLEKTPEYFEFLKKTSETNSYLNLDKMDNPSQTIDMRAASGSILNALLAEEGLKENIKMPPLFETEAKRER